MITDIINPDLYKMKTLNNFNSEIVFKEVIALFILNLIYLFCKEFFHILLINLGAVIFLVKLNELVNAKRNVEFPSIQIFITDRENNHTFQIETKSSCSKPYVIVNPSQNSPELDCHDDKDFNEPVINLSSTNNGVAVNGIDSHPNYMLQKNSSTYNVNTVESSTQTDITLTSNSVFKYAPAVDKATLTANKFIDPELNNCNKQLQNQPSSNSFSKNSISISEKNQIDNIFNDNSALFHLNINSYLSILPKFDGNSYQFLSFKNRFQTVINQFKLNISQKAVLLYLSLAEKVAESLPTVGIEDNLDYYGLWNQLENEYFGPQHGPLYNGALLNTIRSWSICNTSEKLSHLYKFVMNNFKSLEIQGLAEPDLVTAITVLGKLEGDLATEVSKTILENQGRPVLLKILRLIKEDLNNLELQQVVSGSHNKLQNTENITLPQSLIKNCNCECTFQKVNRDMETSSCRTFKNRPIDKCKICYCYHDPKVCPKFTNPYDFYLYLKKTYACFNCAEVGHRSFACPKLKMCDLCTDPRKHSPLLCNKNYNYIFRKSKY